LEDVLLAGNVVMTANDAITEACQKYIEAVVRAKQRTTTPDHFWKDKRAGKAYKHLFKVIQANVPPDLQWWYTIWELAGSTSEQILEGRFEEATDTPRFCRQVNAYLDALAGHDWIASLPLEHVFSSFPPFTDFGGFHLVNPAGPEGSGDLDELLGRFRTILTDKLGVAFPEPKDFHNDSYLRLGDHFFKNKSDGYIPGRPQMVIRVGRGDEFVNKQLLPGLARQQLSLLALCQIAYELDDGFQSKIISPAQCRLPNGEHMQAGVIEIPQVAVAIETKTGESAIWGARLGAYETQHGLGYEPEKFMAVWNDLAKPVLDLEASLSGDVGDAVRNAIKFVGKCRHPEMGDLTLNSVIATETILNPFKKMGTSEGFGMFAGALAGASVETRIETYRMARGLYHLRNQVVHQSRHEDDKAAMESHRRAFGLFRTCLKGILQWVKATTEQGRKCDKEAFDDFYLRTILGGGT
jgi:hypothetical protein